MMEMFEITVEYKIRSIDNGFTVEHGRKSFTIEYFVPSGLGEKEMQESKTNYEKAQERLLAYISQQIKTERQICPDRTLKLRIVWTV